MNKNSSKFCYNNACIQVEGEAAKTINTILVVAVAAILFAAVVKAIS